MPLESAFSLPASITIAPIESAFSSEVAVTVIDKRTYEMKLTPNGGKLVLNDNFLACPLTLEAPVGSSEGSLFIRLLDKPITFGAQSVTIKSQNYYWPQMTDIIYEIAASTDLSKPIAITLNLASQLTPYELERAEIRRQDGTNWVPIDITRQDGSLIFQVIQSGTYAVFINQFDYALFTSHMAALLPSWMEIRKNKDSVGQQFLNHFGIEFQQTQDYLDWCLNNQFINKIDVGQIDYIYKTDLPVEVTPDCTIYVFDNDQVIQLVDTVEEFYRANNHVAIIDFEKHFIYTRFFYENGIDITAIQDGNTRAFNNLSLRLHHVWNSLDEFGLLLGVKRLPGEKNIALKERILDVFHYPANATKLGLYFGIARELGLIQRVDWKDDSQPLVVQVENVLPESICLDGKSVPAQIGDGYFRIEPLNTGVPHKISYIAGISIHALVNQDKDETLYSLLYEEDNHPTDYYHRLSERIQQEVPIMWDEFRWDEGFWDVVNRDMLGLEYLPTIWDASAEVWRSFDANR